MGAHVNRGRVIRPPSKSSPAPEPAVPSAININTDDADALRKIKGVGKKTASDIVASREADGPFESLADCADRVGGVSLSQLESAGATV